MKALFPQFTHKIRKCRGRTQFSVGGFVGLFALLDSAERNCKQIIRVKQKLG